MRNTLDLSILLLTFSFLVASPARAAQEAGTWHQIVDLEAAGWSQAKLEEARQLAVELRSGAVFVVHRGQVVAAWGDVTRPFKMASARKSLVSALYGIHVESGKIDLEETLAELGIDDLGGLSEAEKKARVVDLLSARSGVYHGSAYEPSSMKRNRPERGSAAAGERWFYNNWDFNTLGTIFELKVGRGLFDEFLERIARPLAMEDFSLDHTVEFLEPSSSEHAAHLFRMSARDMARFGQLYLSGGSFGGKRILSPEWIETSTKIHSELWDDNPWGAAGYGYLWWVYPARSEAERASERVHSIVARGNGGQVLAVLPEEELVFVHCGDWYHERGVSYSDVSRILDLVLAARSERLQDDPSSAEPELGPLEIRPFEHSLPAPMLHAVIEISEQQQQSMVGTFRVSDRLEFRVHLYQGRLFAKPEGAPLAELELFPIGEGVFYSPVFPLRVTAEVRDDGSVDTVEVQMGPNKMVGQRQPDG